jgi:hypothetical protein
MDSVAISILEVFLIIVGVICYRAYQGNLDRGRIREHVESSGGQVENIEAVWRIFGTGWRATRNARLYEVRYKTHHGRTITATCATNMFGVWWPREGPPGLGNTSESSTRTPHLSPEEIRQSLTTPAEAITCLACGAKIPARQTHCPHCGWSYEGR